MSGYDYMGRQEWESEQPSYRMLEGTTHHVARRWHSCNCNLRGCEDILPGQRYSRMVGIFDGKFSILKYGEECGGRLPSQNN